jgi:threonine/homoserine/homoserine lactone efflux protein
MLALQAAFIGLSIAAPVGPIGLLCIQRTLDHGVRIGLATGLGAAVADATYGLVGALGLQAVITLLVGARGWLSFGGGLFLVWLGVDTLRRAGRGVDPAGSGDLPAAAARAPGVAGAFAGTFLLTLSNPMTILSFVAVFASLSSGLSTLSASAQATMVGGVLVGSAAWWLMLTAVVARLRRRLGDGALAWIRRGSGALVAGFGVYQLGSALARYAG